MTYRQGNIFHIALDIAVRLRHHTCSAIATVDANQLTHPYGLVRYIPYSTCRGARL